MKTLSHSLAALAAALMSSAFAQSAPAIDASPKPPSFEDAFGYRETYIQRDSGYYGDTARVLESHPVYDPKFDGTAAPVIGYDVRYEFGGREYWTRLVNEPGTTLRLGVDVRENGTPFNLYG